MLHMLMRLPDHMVDDDGLRRHQKCMQALRDLRELHSLSLKDLQNETNKYYLDMWPNFNLNIDCEETFLDMSHVMVGSRL